MPLCPNPCFSAHEAEQKNTLCCDGGFHAQIPSGSMQIFSQPGQRWYRAPPKTPWTAHRACVIWFSGPSMTSVRIVSTFS
jgi:hypothetical protein